MSRYELNNPPIVAEMVEGELIAINLETGTYYSLAGPAARIWNALAAGHSADEIVGAVSPPGDAVALRESLENFLESLLAEQLIRPVERSAPAGAPLLPLAPWLSETLRVERFTDMQDLLVLDPIHEVDEAGWPKPLRG
jgi:coenzyme PQQ synthesis protein D (PqqD)